jgi:hypothetical protein
MGWWIALAILIGAIGCFALLVTVATVNRRYWSGRPRQWLRALLGRGLGIDELARRLDMPAGELRAFTPSYRDVYISKRSGGRRLLRVPDPATKALQRRLLRRLFARLRAHEAACGFERGRSIVDNARPHAGRAVVVRLDVVDFFATTRAGRLERYFRRVGWSRDAARLLVKLTSDRDGLPPGAPTSPRLSNLVNYYLDVQLQALARRRGGAYTRYADDITFSFPRDYPRRVRGVIQKTGRILHARGYRLHRRRKLHIRRRHQRQIVTGLVVNERVRLPRARRRWLRAVRHRLERGRPVSLSGAQLEGWLALASMVEEQAGRSPRPSA